MRLECAYALRYIELNGRSTRKPWSLRQFAVYQRFDSKDGSSTWVILSASEKLETCLDRYFKSLPIHGARNTFEIHILLLETALANWRPFIVSLTQRINEEVRLTRYKSHRIPSKIICSQTKCLLPQSTTKKRFIHQMSRIDKCSKISKTSCST